MSEFKKSEWAEEKHAKEFVENSDIYILERKRLLEVMKSFFTYFENKKRPIHVLDLGCGDGTLTRELLKVNNHIQATLVDGSFEMLRNARENLKNHHQIEYLHLTFQELLERDVLTNNFDFIVSSLAIHHLSSQQKISLFNYIYNHLNQHGNFLNIDTVKAPNEKLETWYRVLWSEWIRENEAKFKVRESFQDLPQRYKNNPDNLPDPLEEQLNVLRSIGFKKVDCYYKYGIFAIFGGSKG
ncbi:MAG TPA: class I SAM-dependent methyltransferase [Methanobacteriaceae archaeon]|nr:class I SAM-dependent methyltransferase [Methanobacteriaceae archaeon]